MRQSEQREVKGYVLRALWKAPLSSLLGNFYIIKNWFVELIIAIKIMEFFFERIMNSSSAKDE